ncbi:hypothetical protein A6P39_015480 [Streptomyces sp. FXJ1.172]|uniref:hypothetical protein n=1 Tax=Streptomyces sp. FXJ1.172 TaxID=710705 RepID=UPI0007CFD5F5|nr:hypothetical protein [Streptomyces sp. FXJ1.172]WEO95313.1 hypothetical protein A6P39_015480 [Streptomyces sp. FXJ1.172]
MSKPNTRRLDCEIGQANRKLEAVRERELWPLTGAEKRAILSAAAGGAIKIVRGRTPARAERNLERAWSGAERRLGAEVSALEKERDRIIAAAAKDKAAKKSSGWW